MKYTQEQLEVMSDFELNCIIADGDCEVAVYDNHATPYVYSERLGREVDFCHNWNDIGPLMEECEIEADYLDGSGATATKGAYWSSCYGNIKRAIAIVYILIKQEGL